MPADTVGRFLNFLSSLCHHLPPPLQGTPSRWRKYAQQVLHWKRAGSERSKVESEAASDEGGLASRMREKALHQQQSVEVKQLREVRRSFLMP